jgi:predicted nucleic-acid-binding Zn-ribbon protein
MMNAHKCPKCSADMQDGFLLEQKLPLRWITGTPEASVFGNIKVHDRDQRQVEGYRCVQCGYLELFAQKEIS